MLFAVEIDGKYDEKNPQTHETYLLEAKDEYEAVRKAQLFFLNKHPDEVVESFTVMRIDLDLTKLSPSERTRVE